MKQKLYVDMDGTLAVFKSCDTLEKLYEKGYFRNLPPQKAVLNAVKELCKNPDFEVYVLSAVLMDSEYALKEKNEWLDEYLPEVDASRRIFMPCGEDKKAYVDLKEGDLLLDDYTKNLIDWEPPGTGVKLLNGINHTNESWRGNTINGVTLDEKTIVDKVVSIANGHACHDIKPQAEEEIDCFVDSISAGIENLLESHFFLEVSDVRITIDRISIPYVANTVRQTDNFFNQNFGSLYSNLFEVRMQVLSKEGNEFETVAEYKRVSSLDELRSDLKMGYLTVKEESLHAPKRKGR